MLALSGDVTRCFRLHAIKLLSEDCLSLILIFLLPPSEGDELSVACGETLVLFGSTLIPTSCVWVIAISRMKCLKNEYRTGLLGEIWYLNWWHPASIRLCKFAQLLMTRSRKQFIVYRNIAITTMHHTFLFNVFIKSLIITFWYRHKLINEILTDNILKSIQVTIRSGECWDGVLGYYSGPTSRVSCIKSEYIFLEKRLFSERGVVLG